MTIMEAAEWSDRFFNCEASTTASEFAFADDGPGQEKLAEVLQVAAGEFLKEWATCPMTADQLVADFMDRL